MIKPGIVLSFVLICLWSLTPACAEDGYDLWLRYQPLDQKVRESAAEHIRAIVAPTAPTLSEQAAISELEQGLSGLLAMDVVPGKTLVDGTVILGTPGKLPELRGLSLPFEQLGEEGYLVRSLEISGHPCIVITANRDLGLVYAVFELLRLIQTGAPLDSLDIIEVPKIKMRLLNHWDNLDRYVERGYAGQSIWDWWRLPGSIDPRYKDYARANASIGINGTVLNNVNASAQILTDRFIDKAAALAEVFRPYGIRVYLSVRFSSPVDLGDLDSADPLNAAVRNWWNKKAEEIYDKIPDFGGFLVKANSEGQPGPQNYGRTHAQGANMMARALQPHGGVVMWRAFVYSEEDSEDRAKQAYNEFRPLDGKFDENVLVQVKNGPLDFQPREPFHPLFGAMPETPLMMEFQLTKEYLGFSTHLVYLGPLYEEVLDADTYVNGKGSSVANIVDGSLHGQIRSGVAGVSNIGSDRDWTGSIFDQANWYAFGRLAWNPQRTSRHIAEEWLKMTFSTDRKFVEPALNMMMRSREAVVNYMTPLGLVHLMGTGHHYGPAPWVNELKRPEWNPFYYHGAAPDGIGFDRTPQGSNAVAQYAPPLAGQFSNPETTPEKFLLWFHRLPWDYQTRSGNSLWRELVNHYDQGVKEVEAMQATWAGLQQYVDAERFKKTNEYLSIQLNEARWWRDACISYFVHQSGLELPQGVQSPAESLEYYKNLEFPYAPGN